MGAGRLDTDATPSIQTPTKTQKPSDLVGFCRLALGVLLQARLTREGSFFAIVVIPYSGLFMVVFPLSVRGRGCQIILFDFPLVGLGADGEVKRELLAIGERGRISRHLGPVRVEEIVFSFRTGHEVEVIIN